MSPRSSCRVAGRWTMRRWGWSVRSGSSGAVVCLVGAALVFSWSWSVYLFHCISFRGDFRCRDGGFRASSAACLVFVFVPSCAFPSVLVRPHLAAGRLSARSSSRLSRRCGGAAARRRLLACLRSSGLAGLAVSPISSRSRLSPVRYGERGGGDVGRLSSCLLGCRYRRRCASSCCSGFRAVACPIPDGVRCGRMR